MHLRDEAGHHHGVYIGAGDQKAVNDVGDANRSVTGRP